ncbi:hypothetical protein M1203_01615 [Streptomyces sp. 35G-GA-8]|nr:hypothetical protein [Streptomyces sp. 35G-GA-8]MCL7375556.1 hypothetical protein [Streptomyces sp. 35G-GA-8]
MARMRMPRSWPRVSLRDLRRHLDVRRRFRRLYGESPAQLLILLASFAVCGYAGVRLLGGDWPLIVLWFVGVAVLHDLVLVPLYSLGDRAVRTALARRRRPAPRAGVNYVRVPAFLSLLLLLVYWPLVLRTPEPYEPATALDIDVFLGRWLLITAALFALSAAWLLIRTWPQLWSRRPRAPWRRPRPGSSSGRLSDP